MTALSAKSRLSIGRLRGPERLEPVLIWLLAFVGTSYLALAGGGYDIVVRSELGLLVWWLVLVGLAAALLPRAPLARSAWASIVLLGAFLLWTHLATGWSSSSERTLAEAGRIATYLGVLVLGLGLIRRTTAPVVLGALATAITLVSALAVLSRLQPGWFPADSARRFYATQRLSYPFDYADGVGEFAALGLPLLLLGATSARALLTRVLAAMGLPVVVLCLALTVSRGGILAAVVGVLVLFAIVPDRLARLGTALVATAGSAIAVVALLDRQGVRNDFLGPAPAGQRHSMLLILVLVCLGVGLVQTGLIALERRGRGVRLPAAQRRRLGQVFAALLGLLVVTGIVIAIASGVDHRLWTDFKRPIPATSSNQYLRLLSVAGSHRYQYWQVAIHAFRSHPWDGIGAGTYEFYWAAHNSLAEFVRNAHSLYIETLAELGIVGALLITAFLLLVLVAGARRAWAADATVRPAVATATAAFAAFCAAAAFDWVWQIGVIPMVAMLLAAVALGGDAEAGMRSQTEPGTGRRNRIVGRVALAAVALVSAWVVLVPLATTVAVRSSQAAVGRGDIRGALADAATAQAIEPGAASPALQRALILEQLGDVRGALATVTLAERRERDNWRIWLVASRIATEADRPGLALADYRRAKALNPTSLIFAS